MRHLLLPLFFVPLAACEPAEASESPVTLTPGAYIFDLPMFIQTDKNFHNRQHCIQDGAEASLPAMLMNLPFEAMRKCTVGPTMRKGNYLTISGSCEPPKDFAGGSIGIEGTATVSAQEMNGNFKLDTSKLDKTSTDAKKASVLAGLTRFKFKAKRVGDC